MSRDLAQHYHPPGTVHRPENAVVGAINSGSAPALLGALNARGIADDAIWVLTDDRRDDFELSVEGGGLRGTVQRAVHSMGYELDVLRALRDELRPGRLLVRVDGMGDREIRRKVAEAYWQNGGSHVSYLSRFTIEDMLPG